jgi:hypothetical protein
MTPQSRARFRVQQQEDGENHLISCRFLQAHRRIAIDGRKNVDRFWRHNDLIEVKDGRYESTLSRCGYRRVTGPIYWLSN